MRIKYEGRTIADDMVDGCTGIADKGTAVKAIRAVCRYFGGTNIYIPVRTVNRISADALLGVLADAVGDREAELILEKITRLFGGGCVYIPFEKRAFKREIALEIYESCYGKEKFREFIHKYSISFSQVYSLWKMGRKYKLEGEAKL